MFSVEIQHYGQKYIQMTSFINLLIRNPMLSLVLTSDVSISMHYRGRPQHKHKTYACVYATIVSSEGMLA